MLVHCNGDHAPQPVKRRSGGAVVIKHSTGGCRSAELEDLLPGGDLLAEHAEEKNAYAHTYQDTGPRPPSSHLLAKASEGLP